MSSETLSDAQTPEFPQLLTFPISDKAIDNSLAWLSYFTARSRENLTLEEKLLRELDPTLSTYITEMAELRGQLQLNEDQLGQYKCGAIFGVNLLANQFDSVGLVLPPANTAALDTYFKSLLTDPDSWKVTSMRYTVLVANQPTMIKGALSPHILARMYQENPSDPLLKMVQKTFDSKSTHFLAQMWNSETEFATAIPAINNVVNEGKRGFFLGISDVYTPVKMDYVVGPYVEVVDALMENGENL